ncbi:nuclear transport factor 2 family protein [Streptomyces sp. Inha503]|uniref:nuclear transport factor 2 family protein n=1 Tax=Streptomyces sp. Inha503 TaxID=3383314 RepID=UPI00399FAE62
MRVDLPVAFEIQSKEKRMNVSSESKALVLAFFEDLSTGRLESALSRLDEDLEYCIAGNPKRFPLAGTHSKQGFVEVLTTIGATMPDGVRVDILSAVAEESRVVIETAARGVSATGKTYDNRVAFSCEVRDGKIRSVREYLDTIHANEVLAEQLR